MNYHHKSDSDATDISLLDPREVPKVEEILARVRSAISGNTDLLARMQNAERVRSATWDGQTRDARRGLDDRNRPTGPWENSSDTRIRLADMICNEKTLILLMAMLRSQLTATPAEMDDTGTAARAVALLRHYLTGSMEMEVWMEVGRAIDLMVSYGHGILRVDWKRSARLVEKSLTYEALLDWARQAGAAERLELLGALAEQEGITEIGEAEQAAIEENVAAAGAEAVDEAMARLTDAEQAPLVEMLMEYDADMATGEASRLARGLRRARMAEFSYYAYEITESRPCLRCLQPWVDVFYTGLTDFQSEPFIAEVEWVTAFELRERAALEGWDPDWTAAVLAHPGRAFSGIFTEGMDWVLSGTTVNWTIPALERDHHYFCLLKIFYKASNRAGITGVWEMLCHECYPEGYAYHRLADFPDGQYPHVPVGRQITRRLSDCTGIPEEVESEQEQLKAMADSRIDMTSLDVQPPLAVHWKLADRDLRGQIRPGGVVLSREDSPTAPMRVTTPGAQSASLENERQLMEQVARRFGLIHPTVPDTVTQMHMAVEVGHFMKSMNLVLAKVFAQLQENMDPITAVRVAGGPEVFASGEADSLLSADRDEIRGRYDFRLTFDPNDLNLEWVMSRVEAIIKLVTGIDTSAFVDRAGLLRAAVSAINPRLAKLVRTSAESSAGEAEDEQRQWSVIASGDEPPMPTQGVDFASRYEVWKRLLSRSTTAQQRLREDPLVLALAQNRLRYLKQGIQQQQNAITGRRGTPGTFEAMEPSLIGE